MDLNMMALAGLIAFAMAWAIGAQDVSNALGTSVGSKAITVQQAVYIAGVCEFLGSLAGGEVAGTISSGILDRSGFIEAGPYGVDMYAHIMLATMIGAFAWLAVATYFSLPVSTTHSLVGGLKRRTFLLRLEPASDLFISHLPDRRVLVPCKLADQLHVSFGSAVTFFVLLL